jgi:hypothetical protein
MSRKSLVTRRAVKPQILALYAGAGVIMVSGLGLAVASIFSGYTFSVMGNPVHGAVFGSVEAFLGVRYFLAVQKLARQIDSDGSQFSWSNLFHQKKQF